MANDRRQTQQESAHAPKSMTGSRVGGANETQSQHAIGLGLGGNNLLIWLGGGVLLAAALASVGLFGAPGSSNNPSASSQTHNAAQASLIRPVSASETEQAIGRLMMSEPDKQKVSTEVAHGKLRLGWITVSDNFEEDGDWVRVAAGGFRQDVRLLRKPYTFAVPYLPGMPVTVTGLVDGAGGGITVAVYVGAARLSLKPLTPGQSLEISSP